VKKRFFSKVVVKGSFGLMLIFGTIGFSHSSYSSETDSSRRMIIQLNKNASSDQLGVDLEKSGGLVVKKMKYRNALVVQISKNAADAIKSKNKNIISVEDDVVYEIIKSGNSKRPGGGGGGTVEQPLQEVPWGIQAINSTDANVVSGGEGAVVCIVDTGIDSSHPDLAANVIGGENFVAKGRNVDSSKWQDDNEHGTHVAGTVAALDNNIGVVGVAPRAKLFAAKVLNSRGSGYSSDVADGILSCVANGADVINMSLGSASSSAVIESAVKAAYAAGLIIVAAAGNSSSSVGYPAKYPEVIAVSAIDSSMQIAYFSNTGSEIQYAAPGVNIRSTVPGGGYANFNGTSMASPHVAGVAALMISSGSARIEARDIGLSPIEQGLGLVDALLTVSSF